MNRRYFYIKVYSWEEGGDENGSLISMTESDFQKFLPLIQAINDYSKKHCCEANWGDISKDEDYSQTLYDMYPQFSEELLDEFNDKFIYKLAYNFGDPVADHIKRLQEVQVGKLYIFNDVAEFNLKIEDGENNESINI